MISSDGSLDKGISSRISKASQALRRLHNRVLNHHNVTMSTKLKVYNAVVIPSLLYGCETWTVLWCPLKHLEKFHMWALCSILVIRWKDRVTNIEVLDKAKTVSFEAMLLKSLLQLSGHVIWMANEYQSSC